MGKKIKLSEEQLKRLVEQMMQNEDQEEMPDYDEAPLAEDPLDKYHGGPVNIQSMYEDDEMENIANQDNQVTVSGIKEEENMEEEAGESRYMFFNNLMEIKRKAELLLELDKAQVEELLENGHDWAEDHITVAKEDLGQVFDFIMNKVKGDDPHSDESNSDEMDEPFKAKEISNAELNESIIKIKANFSRFL
jgi:hypothetical protein